MRKTMTMREGMRMTRIMRMERSCLAQFVLPSSGETHGRNACQRDRPVDHPGLHSVSGVTGTQAGTARSEL